MSFREDFAYQGIEQRIDELEARIENASNSSGGEITIEVTVNTADQQQNFVEGGKAVVTADSENAAVSRMRVEYGGGTYQLGSSGQVAIPLADTGEQVLTLIYGETTKQVSINVQEHQAQQADRQQDGTTSGGSGPGFSTFAAVLVLLAVIVFLYREW